MQWLLSLLASPFFSMLLKGWQMKLDAASKAGAQAVDVAKAAMIAEVQARAEANKVLTLEYGRWWTALPRWSVEAGTAAYYVKCLVWDTTLGWGTTNPLRGDIQTVFLLVMTFWFGAAAISGVLNTVRRLWR